MGNDTLKSLMQSITERADIPSSEVPEIDLYMDQVTTFIDEKLAGLKRTPQDKVFTKTMINNYTKDKILPPPEKKKYSKNHILLLILIYRLKNCLTITDTGSVISPLVRKKGANPEASDAIRRFYDAFESLRNEQAGNLRDTFTQVITLAEKHGTGLSENERDMLVAAALIDEANERKMLAERIIDAYNKR